MTATNQAMTADLRRLAEQAHREPWDYWDLSSWDHGDGDQAHMMRPAPYTTPQNAAYIAAANPQAILALLDDLDIKRDQRDTVAAALDAAERRVAALEEGLRNLLDEIDVETSVCGMCLVGDHGHTSDCPIPPARALLAAAPSEPVRVPWNETTSTAALPAEVGE